MQRATIFAPRNFGIGSLGLRESALLGERDDKVQLRVVALQPVDIHLRQRLRSDLARLEE